MSMTEKWTVNSTNLSNLMELQAQKSSTQLYYGLNLIIIFHTTSKELQNESGLK